MLLRSFMKIQEFVLVVAILGNTACPIAAQGCSENCLKCSIDDKCEICKPGFFGSQCQNKCVRCRDNSCNIETGICFNCLPGRYSEDCSYNCSTYCKEDDQNEIHCHRDTGSCLNGCKTSRWGDDCKKNCSETCANDVCYKQDGRCLECKPNWTGKFCDMCTGSLCRTEVKCFAKCSECNTVNERCINCTDGWDETPCPKEEVTVPCSPISTALLIVSAFLLCWTVALVVSVIAKQKKVCELLKSHIWKRLIPGLCVLTICLAVVSVVASGVMLITFCSSEASVLFIVSIVLGALSLGGAVGAAVKTAKEKEEKETSTNDGSSVDKGQPLSKPNDTTDSFSPEASTSTPVSDKETDNKNGYDPENHADTDPEGNPKWYKRIQFWRHSKKKEKPGVNKDEKKTSPSGRSDGIETSLENEKSVPESIPLLNKSTDNIGSPRDQTASPSTDDIIVEGASAEIGKKESDDPKGKKKSKKKAKIKKNFKEADIAGTFMTGIEKVPKLLGFKN